MRFALVTLLGLLALSATTRAAEPRPPVPILLPPFPPSPIEEFRRWLRLGTPEREAALADWSEARKAILLAKLQSYDQLPAAERERRLHMTELRWYLLPLMRLEPARRSEYSAAIPARLQPLITARLAQWDLLDLRTRQDILQKEQSSELVAAYFSQVQRGRSPETILRTLDDAKRQEMRRALTEWSQTTPAQRQRMPARLNEFFAWSGAQQARALERYSERAPTARPDEATMTRTLRAFAALPAAERRACLESFQKFAGMSAPDQSAFLKNAERWQTLSEEERAVWRRLAHKLPPMPPAPPPPTPLPPAVSLPAPATTTQVAATNEPAP